MGRDVQFQSLIYAIYNTTAPGNIIVINKAKKHKGEIPLINASKEFAKGRPKNHLTDENIKKILDAYFGWKEIGNRRIFKDYNDRRSQKERLQFKSIPLCLCG